MIILCFFFFSKTLSYLNFPFETKEENIELKESNFFDKHFYNNIQIQLNIGNPHQTIPFSLMISEYPLVITSKKANLDSLILYDQNNSKSYNKLDDNPLINWSQIYVYCYFSNDIFSLAINSKEKKEKEEKFNFFLSTEMSLKLSGILGLSISSVRKDLNEYGFIYQLRNKKLIESRSFFIKYNEKNKNIGELIIGKYPHEIYPKEFKENKFKFTRSYINSYKESFTFNFDVVYYNNELIQERAVSSLEIEKNFIQGTAEFGVLITKNFFSKYVDLNLCKEVKFKLIFYSYICDKNIDLSDFGVLKFILKDANFSFVFEANDVFYEMNNELYFMIFYSKLSGNSWSFGKIFFQKYLIVFDQERKIIGFYERNHDNIIIKPFLIILVICALIIFNIFLIRYFSNSRFRKKRANELIDDNYEYLPEKII